MKKNRKQPIRTLIERLLGKENDEKQVEVYSHPSLVDKYAGDPEAMAKQALRRWEKLVEYNAGLHEQSKVILKRAQALNRTSR